MYQKKTEKSLPEWLWFFLLLPIVLVVALLYKRGRLPRLAPRRAEAPRYVEPDSIPLNMIGERSPAAPYATDDEDVALSRAAYIQMPEDSKAAIERDADGETPQDLLDQQEASASRSAGGAQSQTLAGTAAEEAAAMAGDADKSGEPDDLKVIEGIGPAIAGILRENGIRTFRQLAAADLSRLTEILTAANLNRLADPGTWSEQAALAADGKWDALEKFQGTLKAGRRKE